MKKMKFALFVILVSLNGFIFAQTKPSSPLDPIITKFNDGANKVNTGDYTSAIAEFEEVLVMADGVGASANDLKAKAQEQIPILNYQLATGYMKQRKYEEAIPYLEKTIQMADAYSNNAATKEKAIKFLSTLLVGVGTQKYKDQDLDNALKYFQSALNYSPDDAKAYLGMGLIYADKMDEEKMISNLKKSIDLAKAAGDEKTVELAQQKLGLFYINIGNVDLADVNTEDPDYSYAIADFEKAISFDPQASDAYYMLSMIYNQTQNFDKGLEYGLKALKNETVDVKIAAINYELGIAYFNTAEYAQACESFKKALVGPVAEKAQARKEKVPGCN